MLPVNHADLRGYFFRSTQVDRDPLQDPKQLPPVFLVREANVCLLQQVCGARSRPGVTVKTWV